VLDGKVEAKRCSTRAICWVTKVISHQQAGRSGACNPGRRCWSPL